MSELQIAADIAEAGDEELMPNQGNWTERMESRPSDLPWRAVRAAIWAAGKAQDGASAQDVIKRIFNDLNPCTLDEAHKQLDAYIALGGTQPADKNSLIFMGEGARLAKSALDKEMGVSHGAGGRGA